MMFPSPGWAEGNTMDQVVIVPTIDPTDELAELIKQMGEFGFRRFIVVDDGSQSDRGPLFDRLESEGCVVVHHEANRGKGAAIKTALGVMERWYPDAPGCITVDADGQHLPADVLKVAKTSELNPDALVIGSRNLRESGTPRRSRFGNAFSSLFFRLDTGRRCADTQTGLRCIPRELLAFACQMEGERYEYEMNLLTAAAKSGIPIVEVPIATVYVNDNAASHFRTFSDSYRIYRSFIRFTASSLSCALVDLGLFAILTSVLGLEIAALVMAATAVSRVSSGVLNFLLNRRWSFQDTQGRRSLQALRYAALFVSQMLLSAFFVTLLAFLPLPLVVVKIFVDSVLFVFSYFFQRNWVFKKTENKTRMEVLSDGVPNAIQQPRTRSGIIR